MKKIDFKWVLRQLLFMVLASIVIGEVLVFALGFSGMANTIVLPIGVLMLIFILWARTGCCGSKKQAKKTFENGIKENHFGNYNTFDSSNSYIVINEDGRIGFVSAYNPKEFQMAMPNEITNVRSSHINSPLGGTTYVYFAFTYKGKETKIPTFTSSQVCSLKSSEVLEGISKADAFADMLKIRARKIG
jgi:hypothetical protein